jgi:hypothetical protein
MAAEISLGYYEGSIETVIDALIAAGLDGAMLELEGDVLDELEGLIEAVNAAHPELAEANRRATQAFKIGPITFGVGPHRVPIEGDNLTRLRGIVDPGFITELAVRDADGLLVSAHDVGDGEIWVTERLPKEAADRMRTVLRDGLRPPPRA